MRHVTTWYDATRIVSVHHMVSRICGHQRGWSPAIRVVCGGHLVVHRSGNLGDSSHLSRLGQITSLHRELLVHTIDERLLQDSLGDQTTGI